MNKQELKQHCLKTLEKTSNSRIREEHELTLQMIEDSEKLEFLIHRLSGSLKCPKDLDLNNSEKCGGDFPCINCWKSALTNEIPRSDIWELSYKDETGKEQTVEVNSVEMPEKVIGNYGLKKLVIKDREFRIEKIVFLDTVLDDNVEIIKQYLSKKSTIESYRDFSNDYYFDIVEWSGKYYEITPAKLVEL